MSKIKHRLFVISLLAIVIAILSQGTLAYYTTVGKATNVVTSGNIRLVIRETTADGSDFPEQGVYVMPGQVVSKRVHIENDCEHPFYLRVKLVNGINSTELSAEDCLRVNLNTDAWTLRDDGFIYYNEALLPGQATPCVFTEVTVVGERVDRDFIGKTLSLTVDAYAVQQENNPAEHPWDAQGWPAERGKQ